MCFDLKLQSTVMCGRTCVRPLVAKHLRTGMSATGWTRYNFEYDRLRGSASTVLTATGQVNGRWQILTPTESKSMSRLKQNSAQLIMSTREPPKPNLVQIHPLGASGQMGENVTFCAFFIYLYIFGQPSIYIDGWPYGMRTSVVCNVPVLSQNDSTYHHSVFTT